LWWCHFSPEALVNATRPPVQVAGIIIRQQGGKIGADAYEVERHGAVDVLYGVLPDPSLP
jgi:hypothetical protein